MTIQIPSQDKSRSINLIEQVLDRFAMTGLRSDQQAQLREHLRWMRQQTPDMNVNFIFSTVPELQMTRMTLEISFAPIPPVAKQ